MSMMVVNVRDTDVLTKEKTNGKFCAKICVLNKDENPFQIIYIVENYWSQGLLMMIMNNKNRWFDIETNIFGYQIDPPNGIEEKTTKMENWW